MVHAWLVQSTALCLPAAVVSGVLLILYQFHNPSDFAARHPTAAVQTVSTASDVLPLDCEPSVHSLVLRKTAWYRHQLVTDITVVWVC